MTLALSVAALTVSTLACWYTRRAALRARQAALRARRAAHCARQALALAEGEVAGDGDHGVLTGLDPEECVLDQDMQCIRPSHHPQDDDQ